MTAGQTPADNGFRVHPDDWTAKEFEYNCFNGLVQLLGVKMTVASASNAQIFFGMLTVAREFVNTAVVKAQKPDFSEARAFSVAKDFKAFAKIQFEIDVRFVNNCVKLFDVEVRPLDSANIKLMEAIDKAPYEAQGVVFKP